MENKEVHTTFELGDVVVIHDIGRSTQFTAHCVEKIDELMSNNYIRTTFKFAVDNDDDHNLSYVVGEDRSQRNFQFQKIIGNIKTSSYVPIY